MPFDFISYLARIDPTQSYNVQQLTGGLVNLTVRASRASDCDASSSRFSAYSSFILKYAPPYVASIGPDAPFSTFRQTIEARALSLFLPSPNSLHHLCEESGVRVPTLLHHDQDEHVLIISDLGLLPNLTDCFTDLFRTNTTLELTEDATPRTLQGRVPISPAEGLAIGQKAGSFFAGLHHPANVLMIHSEPYNDTQFLRHDGMRDVVLETAIRPLKEQLNLFPHLLPRDAVPTVYQWVEDDFTRATHEDEKVIALGDCWTGALLVGLENSAATPQVGVIDWEFACIGRGTNGDMAQLLAHLCLFGIAAAWQGKADSRAAIDGIIQGLIGEYRRRSHALGYLGLAESGSLAPKPHSWTARLMRSAFLAHGAEMISNTFMKEWACDSALCCGKECKEKPQCKLIQQMVETGCWYLSHAREDDATFVTQENWDAVQHEHVLSRMF